MKKCILTLLCSLFVLSIFAQDDQVEDVLVRSNEIKINALYTVVGAFDITYERLLNEESGVGLNVFFPYDEDIKDDINYYVSPYYRLYFGNKYASGFFVEGFGMLHSTNYRESLIYFNEFDPTFNIEEVEKTETNFALGIGTGGKWYTKSGFVGELSFGFGRNLLKSDYNSEFVGKLAITVGYRF
ncbi:DUF3575 domain-containing protein [Psychroserpens mesophilus]|uniref:DUF3575 domain-containing protein n=1 Tax=Psychroserpens mesophilus TaxID=325473 RepID=UPI00058DDBEC|nr:DUF3575 domain-containing protein [Psychroserpens mesophilus]